MEPLSKLFSDLVFLDEGHKYILGGSNQLPSVSSIIKNFYEPFDAKKIAPYSAKKAGVSTQEILAQWADTNKESIILGHNTHNYGEDYLGSDCIKAPSNNLELGIIQYWMDVRSSYNYDQRYKIKALELPLFHYDYMYAGTPDVLIEEISTGELIIVDYKTNKDLHKNYKGKKMYAPFEAYYDCPLTHYWIQQNLYAMALESAGVKIKGAFLVHLLREAKEGKYYQKYRVPDLRDPLTNWLNNNPL